MERAVCLAVLVFAAGALGGCASARAVEPGLANVPAVPGASTPDGHEALGVHDAIANAHDSCPRARSADGDPLRFRYPPCGVTEAAPADPVLVGAPRIRLTPNDALWNLHLHGLPPCEGEHSGDSALVLCRAD